MGRIKEKRRNEVYHVAVCEDEAVLRRELCGQCEVVLGEMQVSHRVTAFSSAEELEAALASGETFSLLCLDILMGGKNGMELARELRAREDETSILFITGSTEFLRDGYSVRPIQYLLKPVEPEALRQGHRNGPAAPSPPPQRHLLRRGPNTGAAHRGHSLRRKPESRLRAPHGPGRTVFTHFFEPGRANAAGGSVLPLPQ